MNRVRVKICGVRTIEEAQAAVGCGVDALGFNFWPKSPRFIEASEAEKIIRRLPPLIPCVGVFVNETAEQIHRMVERTGITLVQLHGDEGPEVCRQITSAKVIKAFRVSPDFDLSLIPSYPASAFLLDAKVKGEYGGTGQRFDWQLAIEAKKVAPIILAGGIDAENVAEAIQRVRPFAVDVCSGVEAEPGKKDQRKLHELMKAVELANRNV